MKFYNWTIHVSRINTSNEDAYEFAKKVSKIDGIEIDLSKDSFGGNLPDSKYTGYLIIICRLYTSKEEVLLNTCRQILNIIPGNVKVTAVSLDEDNNSKYCRNRKEYYFSKFKSLSGISFSLIDKVKDKLQHVFKYLDDRLEGNYFTIYFDECYINVIVDLDMYCLEHPIMQEPWSLNWEIYPWLESDGSSLNFPQVDNGLRWKIVPCKDRNYWDVSGDDLSLDPRFW